MKKEDGKGNEPTTNNYIRFDWAMKCLLRNKVNFVVLEGFLTTPLDKKIIIQKLLESEGNQEDEFDKYNRVGILAENSKGESILTEAQNNNEYAYPQCMLFGASKLVAEYISREEGYDRIRKVYSVSIIYSSLGNGKDIVYHGKMEFGGIHQNDVLELTPFQKQTFKADAVSQFYPEYYILKVDDFNQIARSPLEEWICYPGTGDILDSTAAPGLTGVRERLELDKMTKTELEAYYRYLDNIVMSKDSVLTERAEGRVEGYMEEKRETARNMKALNIPINTISQVTGLPTEEIQSL